MGRKKYTISEINKKIPPNCLLVAISQDESNTLKTIFKCVCGNVKSMITTSVTYGGTKSCGCYKKTMQHPSQKYFPYIPNLYAIWSHILGRCHKVGHPRYKDYGARGVRVCNEWRNNYQSFLDWALKSGWQYGLQLDKDIKGTGKLYCPEYCIWTTAKANCNKKRNNRTFDYYGELLSLTRICEKEDLDYFFVIDRIRKNGDDIYRAVRLAKTKDTPIAKYNQHR